MAFGLAAAVGVAAAGCASSAKIEPKGHTVIPLAVGVDRLPTLVHLFDEVVVELPSISKPGDQWTIVFNDGRYLKQISAIEPRAGGGFVVRFYAAQPGRHPVRFLALPPNGRESVASQAHEVIVEIE
jgi:hypothetical protein